MTGGHDPREVLAAVRRLEADLAELQARTRVGAGELDDLRRTLAEDAARARRETIEDMEVVVDLVGAAWRSTGDRLAHLSEQVAALTAEVGEIRAIAEEARRALSGARVELRLASPVGNGETNGALDRPTSA
jgi:multidrug resistance efflux pump